MGSERSLVAAAWQAKMAREKAEIAEWHAAAMRAESPYRAAFGCAHANVVERTCDAQHAPALDSEGRVVLAPFVIRCRQFECADCGVGVWPVEDAVRNAAAQRPRCTAPACDCEGYSND